MSQLSLGEIIKELYKALLNTDIKMEDIEREINKDQHSPPQETIRITIKKIINSFEFIKLNSFNYNHSEIRAQDVFYAYKFFLERAPENDQIYENNKNFSSTKDFISAVVLSNEFRENNALKKLISVKRKPSNFSNYTNNFYRTTDKKILVISGCQGKMLADLLQLKTGTTNVPSVFLNISSYRRFIENRGEDYLPLLNEADIIYTQKKDIYNSLVSRDSTKEKARIIPLIEYTGFHPDQAYIFNKRANTNVVGPLGEYQSIIAASCFYLGLSIAHTRRLFQSNTYEKLGYLNQSTISKRKLLSQSEITQFPLDEMVKNWDQKGIWMRTINHPKKYVLSDLIDYCLHKEGIQSIECTDDYVADDLANNVDWPVYKGLISSPPIPHELFFKPPKSFSPDSNSAAFLKLEQFLEQTFKSLEGNNLNEISCSQLGEEIILEEYIEKIKQIHE
ncbi:WcbI family polysaccharide biosynthesis putative acetyltransferase [Azotobacter salinestris]|uniref:WcbI family polysaccharide biosynthesis putative acetyltransferase n=1 Tax=Azotobacter salinestris TaxID=69964 RepID=UPI0032DF58F4